MLVTVVLLLPIFWFSRPVSGLPARFAIEDCQRIPLTSTGSGEPITGIEDIEMLPDGDTLILSAMDHLAFSRQPSSAPEGGIYRAMASRLAAEDRWATPMLGAGTVEGGLFPHGVAVSGDGERFAFINRRRDGEVAIVGGAIAAGGFSPSVTRAGKIFCRANDLAFDGGGAMSLRVTLDRGDCGLAWADLKPDSMTGRVISMNLRDLEPPKVEETGLAFANGIAGMYVAETRGGRLYHQLDEPLELPGGPDNLNWDNSGGLIAALHPRLFRLAAYRFGYRDNAPSRIVRIDLDRRVEVLFDDPGGELFSGATAAVMSEGVLVAGSVRDAGLLVCQKGGI
jgi:hypothetical protein